MTISAIMLERKNIPVRVKQSNHKIISGGDDATRVHKIDIVFASHTHTRTELCVYLRFAQTQCSLRSRSRQECTTIDWAERSSPWQPFLQAHMINKTWTVVVSEICSWPREHVAGRSGITITAFRWELPWSQVVWDPDPANPTPLWRCHSGAEERRLAWHTKAWRIYSESCPDSEIVNYDSWSHIWWCIPWHRFGREALCWRQWVLDGHTDWDRNFWGTRYANSRGSVRLYSDRTAPAEYVGKWSSTGTDSDHCRAIFVSNVLHLSIERVWVVLL